MKKTWQVFLTLFSLSIMSFKISYAATTVSINNSSSGSDSEVEIHNTVNSQNNTTNTSSSHTSVRVETNGQVKTYESNGNENVHIESDDGTAKVTINNESQTDRSVTITPTITPKVTAIDKVQTIKQRQRNFFKSIEEFFTSFFSKFHFH